MNSLIFSPCKRRGKEIHLHWLRERGRSQQARPFSHCGIPPILISFFFLPDHSWHHQFKCVWGLERAIFARTDIEKYKSSLDTYSRNRHSFPFYKILKWEQWSIKSGTKGSVPDEFIFFFYTTSVFLYGANKIIIIITFWMRDCGLLCDTGDVVTAALPPARPDRTHEREREKNGNDLMVDMWVG